MRAVRLGILAAVAVAVCGVTYVYRDQLAQKLGFSTTANAAEKNVPGGAAAAAQPQGRRGRANPGGAVPVVVVNVASKPMPIVLEAVGTVQAVASIQIKPRLDSQIIKVNVEEGALVKEGDLLFELDARTLRAQLAQIEAQIRKDQALIVQAKRDATRADDLLAKGAGTAVARDTNLTAQKSLEAQLESDMAMRTSVQAQLSYTEIRSPVSGRIGSINMKTGTVVRQSDNTATSVLLTINQVDPIFVAFALPQVYLSDLRAAMNKGPVRVNAIVDEAHRSSGAMAFIENSVDPNTGTVTAKATFANAGETLWPGQFVKAEVVLGIEPSAISVPSQAIQLGAQGPYVFVVNDHVAEVRPVMIKRTQGGESVIGKGLESGESVVIEGQLRLVDGAAVTVKSTATEANPSAMPPRG
jgi:multidrug efflux system membrane fusion protein